MPLDEFSPPEGPHSHKCDECDTVWTHDAADLPPEVDGELSDNEFWDAVEERNEKIGKLHSCPKCGELQFMRESGENDDPDY